jgi:hypothetical protein
MSQLVGLPCSIFAERLGSTLEPGFCETCGNAVHHRCRIPVSPAPAQTCQTCGTDLVAAARRAEERARQRREELAQRPPQPPLDIERYLHKYAVARWFLGAVGALFCGVIVMTLEEPGAILAGAMAVVAGVVMGALGILASRRR